MDASPKLTNTSLIVVVAILVALAAISISAWTKSKTEKHSIEHPGTTQVTPALKPGLYLGTYEGFEGRDIILYKKNDSERGVLVTQTGKIFSDFEEAKLSIESEILSTSVTGLTYSEQPVIGFVTDNLRKNLFVSLVGEKKYAEYNKIYGIDVGSGGYAEIHSHQVDRKIAGKAFEERGAMYVEEFQAPYLILSMGYCFHCDGNVLPLPKILLNTENGHIKYIGKATEIQIDTQRNSVSYIKSIPYEVPCTEEEYNADISPCAGNRDIKTKIMYKSDLGATVEDIGLPKTYIDRELGFEFIYPDDVVFEPISDYWFVGYDTGVRAKLPAAYNRPESFLREQSIYVGATSSSSKEMCTPEFVEPRRSNDVPKKPEQISAVNIIFNKYPRFGDCAMDGCGGGNLYRAWQDNTCYMIDSFYIQANVSKTYEKTDPRFDFALQQTASVVDQITSVTERLISNFKVLK